MHISAPCAILQTHSDPDAVPRLVTLAAATVVVTIAGVTRLVENVTDAFQVEGAALLAHEALATLLVTLTDERSIDAANALAVLSQRHSHRPEPNTRTHSVMNQPQSMDVIVTCTSAAWLYQ